MFLHQGLTVLINSNETTLLGPQLQTVSNVGVPSHSVVIVSTKSIEIPGTVL